MGSPALIMIKPRPIARTINPKVISKKSIIVLKVSTYACKLQTDP
jgi:hypothetical protein